MEETSSHHVTFIIAEAGVNHNGSLERALQMVEAAAAAGADAIKFQTFKTERLVRPNTPKAEYQKRTMPTTANQFDLLKPLELSEEAHRQLMAYCRVQGIQFLSSPFDEESLAFLLNELDVERIKIPSGEISNAPLLLKAGESGKPILLSTGMSTLPEVAQALAVLAFGLTDDPAPPSPEGFRRVADSTAGRWILRQQVTLLHCTTEYPAPFDEVNLRAMETLHAAFDLPVGLSDHTVGWAVAVAAVARGATVVEKHFTLDRSLPGPDQAASLEPDELKQMVTAIRQVEHALGSHHKAPSPSEVKNIPIARKSLAAAREIEPGEAFSPENVIALRPGQGISPMHYWTLLGKKAQHHYEAGEGIHPEELQR